MKALFEFEFDPETFIDDETLKNDFHNDWDEYMKWQYEEDGFGIFTNDATFVKVVTSEENNMPTNDDTPRIDTMLDKLYFDADFSREDLETAIQNVIDMALLNEIYSIADDEPVGRTTYEYEDGTVVDIETRISQLKAKIKEGK